MSISSVPNIEGCFTALITPFKDGKIDWEGFEMNIEFQISQGVSGVVPAGTTGESSTLTPLEHKLLISRCAKIVKKRTFVLAGCGSNSTQEAIEYARTACFVNCEGILLVDCYYNAPSSLELRKEYYEVIAKMFPDMLVVPYIIPSRTGCALLPEDLLILFRDCPNVKAVKDATGDTDKARKIRKIIKDKNFHIMSGDDEKTFIMMIENEVRANGVISVISNIAPAMVQKMCLEILKGNHRTARRIKEILSPLFNIVTVNCEREIDFDDDDYYRVIDKFRNPVPIKTIMRVLGMPSGFCRPPLGKIVPSGIEIIRDALRKVWENNPEVLIPIQEFYNSNIKERIYDDNFWEEVTYRE